MASTRSISPHDVNDRPLSVRLTPAYEAASHVPNLERRLSAFLEEHILKDTRGTESLFPRVNSETSLGWDPIVSQAVS
jgi:hypothetical protein